MTTEGELRADRDKIISPLDRDHDRRMRIETDLDGSFGKGGEQQPEGGEEHADADGPSVISSNEVQRFRDLGLGRGIDAANFDSLSDFQVRPVLFQDLLGTERSGILEYYEEPINSRAAQLAKLWESISTHSALEVTLDAEMSRSATNTRRVIGRKVTTRTVSFALRFEDVKVDDISSGMRSIFPAGDREVRLCESFEVGLSKWIMRNIAAKKPPLQSPHPLPELSEYVSTLPSDEARDKLLQHQCLRFIQEFRVTHFITSIDLGAKVYQVFREADFAKQFGSSANIGFSGEGGKFQSVSDKVVSSLESDSFNTRRIGVINKSDETVRRATRDEAVVGMKILPICSLLQCSARLHLAMKDALFKYLYEEASVSFGPFIVTCSDKLFWKVNIVDDTITLVATDDLTKASLFMIFPHDDNEENPDEFMIMYIVREEESANSILLLADENTSYSLLPVSRYLETNTSYFGHNDGPLQFKYSVNDRDSMLEAISRRVEHFTTFNLKRFTKGEDMCYIRIAHKKSGYLCMKQVQDKETRHSSFVSAIVPNISFHDEQSVFMLFRLLPASLREKPELWEKLSGHKENT